MTRVRSLASVLVVAIAMASFGAGAASGQSDPSAPAQPIATPPQPAAEAAEPMVATPPSPANAAGHPCDALNCGATGCKNYPVTYSNCNTTPNGPARADLVTAPTSFLYCEHSRYALCFFSGPPQKTGKDPKNRPLPCVLSANGTTADCTCQVYTGVSYVDMNGILNYGVWQETVQLCGPLGAGCKNLPKCAKDPTSSDCTALAVPPVCKYVSAQNPDKPEVSLMPKADMISTFSFAMTPNYPLNPPVDCTQVENPLYAGCMTAPCFLPPSAARPPKDGDPIQCQCPTYAGPYQVGEAGQACTIPPSNGKSYVWSAAYNPHAASNSSGN